MKSERPVLSLQKAAGGGKSHQKANHKSLYTKDFETAILFLADFDRDHKIFYQDISECIYL
jgi:hypothetical protein